MTLVGIEKVEYKRKKDGKDVNGYCLYYTESSDNKNVDGLLTGNVFVSQSRIDEISDFELLELGTEFDILYNRFGGVKDIKIL